MAYNRYHGNSGRSERVEEPEPDRPFVPPPPPEPPVSPPPPPPPPEPPPSSKPLEGGIGALLRGFLPERLDTEDLLLLAVLYLLYRETGDKDFLIMLGGVLFL